MDLDKMMGVLENWRINEVTSIASSHQLIAFYLSVLTEEKFRCYALTGFIATQSSLTGHIHIREDVFALEWALRSLNLPDPEFILIDELRGKYKDDIASKANQILADLLKYYQVRDLAICANRGGYLVDAPQHDTLIFKDDPNWDGTSDMKSRLIGDKISAERNKLNNVVSLTDLTLNKTSAYDDFPHNIQSPTYAASDFWALWDRLFEICKNRIMEDCSIRNYGTYAATSKTNELCILVTKKKLVDDIFNDTGIERSTISTFLEWLSFNSKTPRKFTLFHCPLVEVNEKFFLILPHVITMSHVPTIFLRLLAHHDKQLYDAYSTDMEKTTLQRLKNHLRNPECKVMTNVKVDTSSGRMELDIVEYDKNEAVLSVGQAKLTIRADSVAEVDYSNSILSKGLDQLKKNKASFESDHDAIPAVCSKLGIDRKDISHIRYYLLPTRFTGSDYLSIPDWVMCLPIEFCLQPKFQGKSLAFIVDSYCTLWNSIDEENMFSKHECTFEIGGFKITYPGFKMNKTE